MSELFAFRTATDVPLEHLTSLESTLGAKDLQIKLANEEASRLRHEVVERESSLSMRHASTRGHR